MEKKFLSLEEIHKVFPGVYALNNVSLSIDKGEVHGLLGENGAGKSTLMKILGGVYQQDQGEIFIEGKNVGKLTPKLSSQYGIAFVHQELNLAEALSVAENIYMGRLPYINEKLGIIDFKKLHSDTTEILSRMGVDLKSTDLISDLSTAKKQLVEIAKAISQNSNTIIFDEPTTSLSDKDVSSLFKIINILREEGVAIIYISHRLKEIFEICDRATILRDGQYINTCNVSETSQNDLIKMMVGRDISFLYPKEEVEIGETILEVSNLNDYMGKVKDVSFYAKKGEVLGLSGLVGAGRTETVRLLFGADPIKSGNVKIKNVDCKIKSPKDAIKKGLCLLTEDRKLQGLALGLSIEENITITGINSPILKHKELRETSLKYMDSLNIKAPDIDTKVLNLSGGNQQKVIISKWLNTNSEIFIFDEPTKGIDVGAKSEIYIMIGKLVKEGKSVIIISSELPEIMGICDRIYVMCEGNITGEIMRKDFTQELIMEHSIVGGTI